MDVDRTDRGHYHFRLGPVEKYLVIGAAVLLLASWSWIFNATMSRSDTQQKTLDGMSTQIAVMTSQLNTLTQQLADVPGLMRQVAEIKVQTDRNTSDIHEMQQVRKLR